MISKEIESTLAREESPTPLRKVESKHSTDVMCPGPEYAHRLLSKGIPAPMLWVQGQYSWWCWCDVSCFHSSSSGAIFCAISFYPFNFCWRLNILVCLEDHCRRFPLEATCLEARFWKIWIVTKMACIFADRYPGSHATWWRWRPYWGQMAHMSAGIQAPALHDDNELRIEETWHCKFTCIQADDHSVGFGKLMRFSFLLVFVCSVVLIQM